MTVSTRALVVMLLAAAPSFGAVNMALQSPGGAAPGSIVPVSLVADADVTVTGVCAVEVILNWDPARFRLDGATVNGGLPNLLPGGNGFFNNPLNDTFDDGDAIYTLLLVSPGTTIPDTGVLLTTFDFELLGGPASDIEIVASQAGQDTEVLLCSPPQTPVPIGTLTSTTIRAVPTVSQWGLIIMTLLGMVAGTILFARRPAVAGQLAGVGTLSQRIHPPLFVPTVFSQVFAVIMLMTGAGLACTILVVGQVSAVDTAGSFISATIVAYLLHLWTLMRRSS